MTVDEKYDVVVDLFEEKRSGLSPETVRQVESALDDCKEIMDNMDDDDTVYTMLDEIEDMIEVDNLD